MTEEEKKARGWAKRSSKKIRENPQHSLGPVFEICKKICDGEPAFFVVNNKLYSVAIDSENGEFLVKKNP